MPALPALDGWCRSRVGAVSGSDNPGPHGLWRRTTPVIRVPAGRRVCRYRKFTTCSIPVLFPACVFRCFGFYALSACVFALFPGFQPRFSDPFCLVLRFCSDFCLFVCCCFPQLVPVPACFAGVLLLLDPSAGSGSCLFCRFVCVPG